MPYEARVVKNMKHQKPELMQLLIMVHHGSEQWGSQVKGLENLARQNMHKR